ncbi:MAG: hypothetical protein IT321_09685 [Anaerolineae bacterium]|nr:hypothetical protein [Anaerolineae bacterium]
MSEPATNNSGCFTSLMVLLAAIFGSLVSANGSAFTPLLPPQPTEIAMHVDLAPSVENFTPEELQLAADVITKRLDGLALEPTSVEIVDGALIRVGLPPLENLDDVVQTLSSRGLLEFVDFSDIPDYPAWTGSEILTTGQGDHPISETAAPNPTTNQPFVTIISGNDVEDASANLNEQFSQWQVSITFNETAGSIFGEYTRNNIGKPLAIVLDGKVLLIPVIQLELGREAVIQGNFTEADTRRLAVQLGAGALPFALTVQVINGDFSR